MQALENLSRTLGAASAMLDSAAEQIQDIGLPQAREHIRSIAEALVAIQRIRQQLFDLNPALAGPVDHEAAPDGRNDPDRRLNLALDAAYELAGTDRPQQAIELLNAYIENETSDLHREIAVIELGRLCADE